MRLLKSSEGVNKLFDSLFPICRSITGKGLRESFEILSEYIPLEMLNFKTGEKVLNWTIPQEWHIRDAYIKDSNGNKIIDFKRSNLHIVNYSIAVDKILPLQELKKYIHINNALPDVIPYVTSYYDKQWGFCMSKKEFDALKEGDYHVYIDSEHFDGQLDLGHIIIPGETKKEILISSYLCHPSMANNELSGPIVLAMLYQKIAKWAKRNFTYRFLIIPETIGSISYLSRYGLDLKENLHAGIVLTCLGRSQDPSFDLSYKMSREEFSQVNKIVDNFRFTNEQIKIRPFTPINGSDERQFCSPGFNLPVGQFASLLYGEYPEYHTSGDTKELMDINALIENADRLEKIFMAIDMDGYYINKYPFGEVKLGDYTLYPTINSVENMKLSNNRLNDGRTLLNNILMTLNYSDGKHTLLDIANKLSINILELKETVDVLLRNKLIEGPFYKERELS